MAGSLGLFRIGSWTWRSSDVVDGEIDDELDFHIACRVQELVASGMDPQAAEEEARRLFGNRDRIHRECRSIARRRGLWLIAILAMGLMASILTIGWLVNRLQLAEKRNQAMQALLVALPPATGANGAVGASLVAAEKPAPSNEKPAAGAKPAPVKEEPGKGNRDLIGRITDHAGNPVPDANVLLTFKSWPGGKYTQKAFRQKSDKEGAFRFEKLYSLRMQNAFLVTILAEGHAMQSQYVLCKESVAVKRLEFKLTPAIEKTILVQGADGQPLAGVSVWPGSRKPKRGSEDFLIYDQSGTDAGYKTGDDGKVAMSIFDEGDTVELRIRLESAVEPIRLVVDRSPEQIARIDAQAGIQGTVSDAAGKPVDGAKVLLIRKSWPGGQFQMRNFEARTDAKGKYRFPINVVVEEQEAHLVTIVKDGFAFESRYLVKKPGESIDPFEFRLAPAMKKTIQLRSADGKPLADTKVALSQRKGKDAVEHMIYAVSAPSVTFATDAEGRVALNYFAEGDEAELQIVLSDDDSKSLQFTVDREAEQTVPNARK